MGPHNMSPTRLRIPTARNPADPCTPILALFLEKTTDCSIQYTAPSELSIKAFNNDRPTPKPHASLVM